MGLTCGLRSDPCDPAGDFLPLFSTGTCIAQQLSLKPEESPGTWVPASACRAQRLSSLTSGPLPAAYRVGPRGSGLPRRAGVQAAGGSVHANGRAVSGKHRSTETGGCLPLALSRRVTAPALHGLQVTARPPRPVRKGGHPEPHRGAAHPLLSPHTGLSPGTQPCSSRRPAPHAPRLISADLSAAGGTPDLCSDGTSRRGLFLNPGTTLCF